MSSVLKPTPNAGWVRNQFGADLPGQQTVDGYSGHLAPIVVKSHREDRVAAGLARFGLIPAWSKDD